MENWRAKALDYLPELQDMIADQLGPIGLWSETFFALEHCYEEQPINESVIGRIYDFAAWCLQQPQTEDAETDLPTAVAVGLIENIPLSKSISADLHRWLSPESFEGFENLFRYHLSDEEYNEFKSEFLRKNGKYQGAFRL